jgi:hypothetical protein
MRTYKISGTCTTTVLFLALGLLFLSAGLAYSDIPYQEGWPQEVGGSMTAGDLDADGELEIIAYGETIYVWHQDGSLLDGWPKEISRISGAPAIGDLDGDGDLEIVGATMTEHMIYAFHHDGTLVDGWPQDAFGKYIYGSSPVLGDLDRDGDLEVLITNNYGGIYAWHGDGTLLEDWPVGGTFTYKPTTLADIDKDGDLELFTPSEWASNHGWITAYHHDDKNGDGNVDGVGGEWDPSYLDGKPGEIVVGDIDNDGDLEILISTGVGDISFAYVHAWHHDGSIVDGWPRQGEAGEGFRKCLIGDLDIDGDLEILAATRDGKLYIWHHDGSNFNGWPKENIGIYPIIGDVDSDNQVEIIAVEAVSRTEIYAYNLDGSIVDGWPLQVQGRFSIYARTPILLADIDSDNDLEVIASSDKVYIWDFQEKYNPAFIEWAGYRHDRYNSGLYEHKIALEVPKDKGYKRIQTAIDAAQEGDFVEVDVLRYPPILPRGKKKASSKPSNVNLKSGIDIIWSIEVR